jgi:hypothetical protein
MEIDLEEVSDAFEPLFNLPLPALELILKDLRVPSHLLLPNDFLESLNPTQRAEAIRICIICWKVSKEMVFPRQYQIAVTLATLDGQDSLVDVGTGYGKTLCMILPLFIHPKSISIVVSPLCRLQAVQLAEFEKWGIRAVSINQDTPKSDQLYKVRHSLLFFPSIML